MRPHHVRLTDATPLRWVVQTAPVPSPDGEGIKGRGDGGLLGRFCQRRGVSPFQWIRRSLLCRRRLCGVDAVVEAAGLTKGDERFEELGNRVAARAGEARGEKIGRASW